MNSKYTGRAMAALAILGVATSAGANPSKPTCSDLEFLEIEVHGEHVLRDYVIGGDDTAWPPSGDEIGRTVAANGGAAKPGGPGAGGHLPAGIAPGASFCTDSQSPGIHP